MKKSMFVLMSSVVALSTVIAGCGGNNAAPATGTDSSTQSKDTNTAPAASAEKSGTQVLKINIPSEPSTADPGLAKDNVSGGLSRALFDGLTRLDKDANAMNSVANDVKVSDDGLVYTFTLRDSKWSNGDPVTAHDFEFAWKRVLDPKFAAEYAYQLYYVKNGQKLHEGKAKPEELGVKALDDKTLQVTLENPTPFFLDITAFYTYYPVNKKVAEADPKWAMEAKTHVGNGPFKLEAWEHKSKIVVAKNDNYWDKDAVKLDKIEFSMIEDENTELSMFDNGELDWAGQPLGALPVDAIPALKDAGKLVIHPKSTMYYWKFNTEKPPFNNVKIRKAFAYAVNRQLIVDNITQAGQVPTMSILPQTMTFKKEGYFKDNDAETAKKLLEEGMKELGITQLPPITVSYNTSDRHKKIAEAVQDQWKKALGVDVKLMNKEFKVHLDDMHTGNYQIARIGWNADFKDPINYLEMFRDKDGGNNDTRWEHPRYKELIIKSASERDPEKRKQLFAEAEAIFMDEMPLIPFFTDVDVWVQSDRAKGIQVDPIGFIDFKWASVE